MASVHIEEWISRILDIAIADEKGAQEKYKFLALYAKRKEIRELFIKLYQEEKHHENTLRHMQEDFKKNRRTWKTKKGR
ncbi:MAG: ferritin family protein [Acidobacteriota bacterium]